MGLIYKHHDLLDYIAKIIQNLNIFYHLLPYKFYEKVYLQYNTRLLAHNEHIQQNLEANEELDHDNEQFSILVSLIVLQIMQIIYFQLVD